ncbi:MAG: lipoprotein, partial [Sphingobacteriales bacterium]
MLSFKERKIMKKILFAIVLLFSVSSCKKDFLKVDP